MNKKKQDPLSDYREWAEHKDNPGYWINRVSWMKIVNWRLIRRYNRVFGATGTVIWGVFLALTIHSMIGIPFELSTLPWVVLNTIFFLLSVMLFVQKPLHGKAKRSHAGSKAYRKK